MQCPICGYEGIAEEAVFCPHCRHQFRELEYEVFFDNSTSPCIRYSEQLVNPWLTPFTGKEIRQMEIQLYLPAILLMLSLAVVLYVSIGRIPELYRHGLFGVEIRYGGFLCLFIGALIGWIFYRIALYRIESS